MKFGYTDYQHTEFDGGVPTTTFLNQSCESRLELEHKPIGQVHGVAGFQSVNSRFAALGEEAIVPKSAIDTYGLFAVESFRTGAFSYELGVRGERQTISPENGKPLTHAPISGSASTLWDIDAQQQLSLALTRSQRAPQIQELLSNGVHEATRSYERGNAGLGKEISNNLDLAYRFNGDWMKAEISLFHNWAGDYIYQQRTGSVFNKNNESFATVCPAQGNCLPVLASRQADAVFRGFEVKTVLPLMENRYGVIDMTLFSDYTRGSFSNGDDVPRMPPLHYGFQLDYAKDAFSADIRLTRGEAQTHAGANEAITGGYVLLDLAAQYQIADILDTEILLFAKGKNLLNEEIRNSVSYLRNFAPEPGRSGEIGIRVSF